MCGIFCAVSRNTHSSPSEELQRRLHRRGPDSQHSIYTTCGGAIVTLCSTVLSLRGSQVVTQPLQDEKAEYVLCWNGEAWSIDGEPPAGNDTQAVFELLRSAAQPSSSPSHGQVAENGVQSIAAALSRVAGPYAFVFFDALRGRLFYGRDFLGRRSLMTRVTDDGELLLASISDGNHAGSWTEVDASGVFCVDLRDFDRSIRQLSHTPGLPVSGFSSYHYADQHAHQSASMKSVIPRLSLDQSLLPRAEPVTPLHHAVSRLDSLLRASLSFRVLDVPYPPRLPQGVSTFGNAAKVAILFSGGLDCTVLARITHDLIPIDEPIDLLNVAFENPRIHKPASSASEDGRTSYELCPDRITGRASHAELQTICPDRLWRFVAINTPYTEYQQHRSTVISLMHPHNTEMDLSIALALYFAARGEGQISHASSKGDIPYTTTARVLLSGLGADELFAGYIRHATAYKRGGMPALLDELELDISRLGKRNLGRDDRVMSHWSREVRFPYLDEALLAWAMAAPVGDKCGFGETNYGEDVGIEPGKKVLRCLAWKLGMEKVAVEKKRAIQFGSRTAKMETRKTKGTTILELS